MVIVPFRNAYLQVDQDEKDKETYFTTLFEQLSQNCTNLITRCLEANLEDEVDELLKRKRHKQRMRNDEKQTTRMRCCKCGSQKVSDFSRNGHYVRGLDTSWGHVRLWMPQVECQCGGGVRVSYKTLKPRQRIWKDIEAEFRSAYGYGLSLRRIKAQQDEAIGRSLGLRSINERIHEVAKCLPLWQASRLGDPPPVVRLDGIWMVLMKPTGEEKKDKLGRHRKVKTGKRIPILVAQGVWPASGRQEVIGWVLADAEDQDGWLELILQLRQKGVNIEDIQLLIGDGSSGLEALRLKQFPDVPFQRCIFHKLKNLWRDLKVPEGLDRQQIRDYKLEFIHQASQIWEAKDEYGASRLLKAFCLRWKESQPKAVATLDDGFDLTVTYYRVLDQAAQKGEAWPVELLRTTSQLERENRNMRRRLNEAVLFHSETGLSACLYLNQVLCQFMRSSTMPGKWSHHIERQIADANLS